MTKIRIQSDRARLTIAALGAAAWGGLVLAFVEVFGMDKLIFAVSLSPLLGVFGLFVRWGRGTSAKEATPQERTELVAAARKKLQDHLGLRWRSEAAIARLIKIPDTSLRMPVRWSSVDSPEGGRGLFAADGRFRRGDELAVIGQAFSEVPFKRLVILGERASGKSAAATLLVLDLLGKRDGPVPVFFPAALWEDPARQAFTSWLKSQLAAEYPLLRGNSIDGRDAGDVLVDEGHVLPVLDGLDEMPESARGLALEAIENSGSPFPGLVVTCRTAIYDELERWMSNATVIALAKLEPDDVIDYLDASVRRDLRPRWQAVREHLGQEPAGVLGGALSSQLILSLAVQAYDKPSAEPARLLSFPDQSAVIKEVLGEFVRAVFPRARVANRPGRQWRQARAEQWLRYLAVRLPGPEVRWWELTKAARPATRVLAAIAGALLAGPPVGMGFGLALFHALGNTAAARVGSAMAVAAGLVTGIAAARSAPLPSDLQIQTTRKSQAALYSAAFVGIIAAIGVGVAAASALSGVAAGFAFAAPIAILYGFAAPDCTDSEVTARYILTRDLRVAAAFGLVYGVSTGVTGVLVAGPLPGFLFGALCALSGGLLYGPLWVLALQGSKAGIIAWLHFTLARAWLVPQGKIPWRLLDFLDDAHHLGVLRRSAATYEFRHELLRESLAQSDVSPA